MEYISELTDSLNNHFGWNKSRITCFVKMLLAIFVVRTVNLTEIATAFASHSKLGSRYRRLQRFFSQFQLNYRAIAEFLFCSFFTQGEQLYLTLDRTNWKWG